MGAMISGHMASLETDYGRHLVTLKLKFIELVDVDRIQLVTISRPSAYGEYEPYHFVDTEEELERELLRMIEN